MDFETIINTERIRISMCAQWFDAYKSVPYMNIILYIKIIHGDKNIKIIY